MRRKNPHVDTVGDGGLFLALGAGFLAFLFLLGVVALTGEWFGRGVGQTVLEVGLCAVFVLVVGLACRGGDRR
ncbi:hypothetical protein [Amycolatopsis keratiniphila]|uniref:Uncharacterized protein n=1 Tax=Amycolatopsis keratiniphila subsp. keratiniphila TaxID=227715 RepID=A0A1W2M222_9PSEU|nr:hypothetical protein [Amycolatopsis keratiniphila]ONF73939.1 hypothetical protein AVR91_0204200 [Amycolatopsis keratiniphila subsp. keratiniphila]